MTISASNDPPLEADEPALSQDDEGGLDYTLRDGQELVWIRVDTIAIQIRRHGDHVSVTLLPNHDPNDDPLGTCYAYFDEVVVPESGT